MVLDEAYVKGSDPDVAVTLAEVTAHAEFDGQAETRRLWSARSRERRTPRMAAAILTRGGEAAYQAVTQGYAGLDDQGRLLALDVIDNAPCSQSAPLYVQALETGTPGMVVHANNRLVRCQREAAPALSAALASGSEKQKVLAANLLSLVAPDEAVSGIVALFRASKQRCGPIFVPRSAKRLAPKTPRGPSRLRSQSGAPPRRDPQSPARVSAPRAELAGGQRRLHPPRYPDGRFSHALSLASPAAALAEKGARRPARFLFGAATSDADGHVRARATEVLAEVPSSQEPLARALGDAEPRVRDAALRSFARLGEPKAQGC